MRGTRLAAVLAALVLVGCGASPPVSTSAPSATPTTAAETTTTATPPLTAAPTATPTRAPTPTPPATPSASPTSTPVAYSLHGKLVVQGTMVQGSDLAWRCVVSDVSVTAEGAQVVVMNESNTVIGTSALAAVPIPPTSSFAGHTPPPAVSPECHFVFTVEGLPQAKSYHLKIGSLDAPAYSFDDLQSKGWTVELHLAL